MSLDDWHLVFVSICLILIIAACSPIVLANMPRRTEPFFALALLGEEGMAEKYYPDDDPNIMIGDELHWVIYLYNHMSDAKYVAVRVKLLNSTMLTPNSTLCEQSPAYVVYEIRRVVLDNETWLQPFDWSLLDVSRDGNSTAIEGLIINGEAFQANRIAHTGNIPSFRLVLELWTYDEKSKEFIFGWESNGNSRCAWNQIWFNVTI